VANIDVNKEFASVGKKALVLAILEIFFLVLLLIFMFGAFFLVFIIIILLIVIMVFRFLAMGSLKKANNALNNYRLAQCKGKITSSTILFFIGNIFFMGALVALRLVFLQEEVSSGQVVPLIFSIIIGIILLFISGFQEYQGWDRLQIFFDENRSMFPPSIANAGNSGTGLLKVGGILNIFIVLIFIGSILRIIGFFILLSLKKLEGEPPVTVPIAQPAPATQPPPAPAAEPAKEFCPNCGSPVTSTEKFCSACGSEI